MKVINIINIMLCLAFVSAGTSTGATTTYQCSSESRFTFLSPRVVRIEYSKSWISFFEDRPSIAFPHRISMNRDSVRLDNSSQEWCNITTLVEPYLHLSFHKTNARFKTNDNDEAIAFSTTNSPSRRRLEVERRNAKRGESSELYIEHPQQTCGVAAQIQTRRVFDPNFKLENGILSRSGWALVNDSFTDLVEGGTGDFDDGWISAKGRNENSADLFLFGCGLNLRHA